MQKDALYQTRDLSPEKRRAAEILLGQSLEENEIVIVRAAKGQLLKEAPTGEAREEAFKRLFEFLDKTAKRSEGATGDEVEAAIDEGADYVRHHRG